MEILLAIIIGYLFGCINPAYILGRINGFDIREKGSGNCGASNAKVTMGWYAFFIVLIVDLVKTFLAYFVVKYIFKYDRSMAILAGSFAIVGHMFPFYLRFKAGKGFACYIALALLIDWKWALILVSISLICAFISNWIVTATLVFTTGVPVVYGFSDASKLFVTIVLAIITIVIYTKHIENFKRLIAKKEIGINGYYIGTKIKSESK